MYNEYDMPLNSYTCSINTKFEKEKLYKYILPNSILKKITHENRIKYVRMNDLSSAHIGWQEMFVYTRDTCTAMGYGYAIHFITHTYYNSPARNSNTNTFAPNMYDDDIIYWPEALQIRFPTHVATFQINLNV